MLARCVVFGLGAVGNVSELNACDPAITRVVEAEATMAEVDEYEDSDGYTQHDLYIFIYI